MAVFNEPTKWQTSLVNSGDANTIPQNTPVGTGKASFKDGFPQITQVPIGAGGIAPDRKDFNGLFKVLGDSIFYMQNGGVSTYSESFDYVAGRVVLYNGNLYKCIQANGVSSTVVTPDSNTAYWQRIDNFVRSVNGVNADESGNVVISDYRMPDYTSGVSINAPYSTSRYTVPFDCVFMVSGQFFNNKSIYLYINGKNSNYFWYDDVAGGMASTPVTIFLRKGDVIYFSENFDTSVPVIKLILYPLI